MKKRTIVTQRRIVEGVGHIEVQFEKQAVDEDGTVYVPKNQQYHRTVFMVGCDIDAQMKAVNTHLQTMGLEPVEESEVAKIRRSCEAEWTTQCIEAWKEMQKQQELEAVLMMPKGEGDAQRR